MKILAGKMKPNLGQFDNKPDWTEILAYFRGSELQNYFTKVVEDTLRCSMKPQYVDHIPRAVKVILDSSFYLFYLLLGLVNFETLKLLIYSIFCVTHVLSF